MSCSRRGFTGDKNKFRKLITGSQDISSSTKYKSIIYVVRAIGSPDGVYDIQGYKYYKWNYTRNFGVSTLLGGASSSFYCHLTVEAKRNKITNLNWFGNECDIYVDQINNFFKNNLKTESLIEEEGVEVKLKNEEEIKIEDSNKKRNELKEEQKEKEETNT